MVWDFLSDEKSFDTQGSWLLNNTHKQSRIVHNNANLDTSTYLKRKDLAFDDTIAGSVPQLWFM